MGVKDLFSIRKENTNIESPEEDVKRDISASGITFTFNQWGREQAEAMGGQAATLPPAIHAAHRKIIQQVKEDEIQQAQRRAEIQSKIDVLKSENENLSNKKSQKDKELQHEERKIEDAKAEVAAIRNDPSRVTKQQGSPKASFIIGLIINILITIYLFVFYCSTAFSAFFRKFGADITSKTDIEQAASAIFDAQAINHSIQEGPIAVILTLTIPAVFLGLGYLIHKISTATDIKNTNKILRLGSLILVTFVFDALLAGFIDFRIYNVVRTNSFSEMPPFTISMAINSIRFWIIIFSGFVVYLIWGLVFNFVMEEYYKLDRVRVAIEELEKKIKQYKSTCKEIKQQMADIDTDISKNNGEIRRYENSLAGAIVLKTDIDLEISNFVNGWLAYMEFKHFSESEKREVVKIKTDFLNTIANQFETL